METGLNRGDRPRGQINEHALTRIKALQDRSLVAFPAAEFNVLKFGVLLRINHGFAWFAVFGDGHGGHQGFSCAATGLKLMSAVMPIGNFQASAVQLHLKGRDVVLFFGAWCDLVDLGLEPFIRKGIHADLSRLADGNSADITLGNTRGNLRQHGSSTIDELVAPAVADAVVIGCESSVRRSGP